MWDAIFNYSICMTHVPNPPTVMATFVFIPMVSFRATATTVLPKPCPPVMFSNNVETLDVPLTAYTLPPEPVMPAVMHRNPALGAVKRKVVELKHEP